MRVLETEFRKKGVTYREDCRFSVIGDDWRVYKRFIGDDWCGYTLARIVVTPARTVVMAGESIDYEESERFPSDEQWGSFAFDFGKKKRDYEKKIESLEVANMVKALGTQEEVADMLEVSRQAVNAWCRGRMSPEQEVRMKLVDIFNGK